MAEQKPTVGRIIWVKTHGQMFNGQVESVGIVTQVFSDIMLNATVFTGCGNVMPVFSVTPEYDGQSEGYSWRWPPREPVP